MILSLEEISLNNKRINGVELKALQSFPDSRGFFRELVRQNDPFFGEGFGQWSHSKMAKNTVKAWHYHHLQIDWWYVGVGVVNTVLYDNRPESSTYGRKIEFKMGESEEDEQALEVVVRIPQGVLHACKVLSKYAHLFYITSEIYNPEDEGRIPFNSPLIEHDWGKEEELIVSDRDRKTFIPANPRLPLDNG